MPFNAGMIVSIIGVVLALAVWVKMRRPGPVIGILIGAFVIMAITNSDLLAAGGNAVARGFTWAISTIFKF